MDFEVKNGVSNPSARYAPGAETGVKALFVSWDGITDPLGRSQVLPYLIGLSRLGSRISIISFEKPEAFARGRGDVERICTESGITWHPLRYHKRPPLLSTVWDMGRMMRLAQELHRADPFDLIHCRSHIPARTGLQLKRRFGVRFLFDTRGSWPDERVESGSWNLERPLYRAIYNYFKRLEAAYLREADHIMCQTNAGKQQLLTRSELRGEEGRISVVPCCVDFSHFELSRDAVRSQSRATLGIAEDASVAAYLGSTGTWYMLEEMLDFFRVYSRERAKAHLLLVTADPEAPIREAARARGIEDERITIRPASRDQVPAFMAAADIGFFFIKPLPSKRASSPVKMGEMIGLGLPIIANGGVGDVEDVAAETGCGVIIQDFSDAEYERALKELAVMPFDPTEVRRKAFPIFDLERGIKKYGQIYRMLCGSPHAAATPSDCS